MMRKYMKKLILYSVLGAMCFCITACGNDKKSGVSNEAESTSGKTFESVAENSDKKQELPEGKEVVTEYTKFVAPTENQAYNFDTDYQFYMKQVQCGVKTKNGYIVDLNMMHLLDMEQMVYTYMCAQPQCTHDYNECDAFAPTFFGRGYENGSIYNVNLYEEDEQVWFDVVKISEDGQTKENVGEIIKVTKRSKIPLESCGMSYIFHRGYIYYIYTMGAGSDEAEFYNNNSNCLYRMPLDGSGEPEFLMAMEPEFFLGMENMMAYGSYVYFCMADVKGYGEIYRYNTESDQIEKMNIGEIAEETYTVLDGCIIYKKKYYDKILYKYNPMDGTETVFSDMTEMAQGESWDIEQDNEYISVYYTDTEAEEAFFVYLHQDGTYAGKIVIDPAYTEATWFGSMIGGDEYLFYRNGETNEIMYAEKAQMENGETLYLKTLEQ